MFGQVSRIRLIKIQHVKMCASEYICTRALKCVAIKFLESGSFPEVGDALGSSTKTRPFQSALYRSSSAAEQW